MEAIMSLGLGYFIGSINPAALVSRWKHVDLKTNGTGNLGATNTMLLLGKGCGLIVMLLDVAKAILSAHLAQKLPVSRLQRDLTDSTVLRNIGVPMAHSVIAIHSTLKGLDKLLLNRAAIDRDLEKAWAVVAEGIQTILRREGYPHPYETLKQLTRVNTAVTAESISAFIDTLDVTPEVREELHRLSPSTYTGI